MKDGHEHEDGQPGEAGEVEAQEPKLFPLVVDELRAAIEVTEAQKKYRLVHVFDLVEKDDWLEFDRLTRMVMESDAETITVDSMVVEAAEWLWAERIRSVEGYVFPGTEPPEDLAEIIPLPHKQAALTLLAQVDAAQEIERAEGYVVGEGETVILEAARNGKTYDRLTHTFRRPTTSQQKEYSRRTGQTTFIRGTKKKTKALIASNLAFLLKLYDELIEKVEGYEPDTPKMMDALHKRTAIQVLMGNV